MKHAISISLGSSDRNKKVTVSFNGTPIIIERIGTDGDEKEARRLFAQMDGKVDALGVGGVELYVYVAGKDYPLRSGINLIKEVKITPAVDGRGLKHTLEARVMQIVEPQLDTPINPKKAVMPLAVDRFGMAQSIHNAGYEMMFCDLIVGLGIPIPIYGIDNLVKVGRILLPIVGQLPISMVYPTGQNQKTITSKYQKWFADRPLIAGDFLYIHKHLPADLTGRMIVTNTTTAADVELLKSRGLKYLATTTPVFDGRSFGTNMLEAALTAYAGKGRVLTFAELTALLDDLNITPTLQKLNY